MLNYDAMKRLNIKPYAVLLALIALLSACSGPVENSGSSNTSAPQQANSNTAPQPQIAQGNPPPDAPISAPPTVQPIPPPPATAKSAANSNANAANALGAGNALAPKLVASEKQIDFGKQPQNKNLVRAIVIKNGGRADLNIESVVPS
jgi:ABC-type Fe3+-hydroxamate transport system substrate-binding protein